MNISGVGAPTPPIQTTPTAETKRAHLQAMLLKKTLEMQKAETAAVMQQAEGKGQTIDIRC
jgi:hypothetical protein